MEWQDTLLQLHWNHRWCRKGMRQSLHRDKSSAWVTEASSQVTGLLSVALDGHLFLLQVDSTTNSLSLPEAWMFSLRPVIAQNDARAGRVMSWKEHRPDKTGLSSWVLQSGSWWCCKGHPSPISTFAICKMGKLCRPLTGQLWGAGVI